MTKLLEQAVARAARLPEPEQDALAARLLDELRDEQAWADRFATTTDAQWAGLADLARADIREDGSRSIQDVAGGG